MFNYKKSLYVDSVIILLINYQLLFIIFGKYLILIFKYELIFIFIIFQGVSSVIT